MKPDDAHDYHLRGDKSNTLFYLGFASILGALLYLLNIILILL